MTLNLMLTSKDAVYLSGDFRITSLPDQVALPDSYDSPKLIPVIRRDWSALIAYAGLASAPPLLSDMGQWIMEQMDSIPFDGGFSELSRRLLRSNLWLGKIRGDRRIAFSVVGFTEQRPFMLFLSNFLDTGGTITDAGSQLKAYLRRSVQPEVRAVGTARPDVFERVKLEKLLKAGTSRGEVPERTRQAVAEINASVARRSRGSISTECVSGYLLRTGSARIGGHGIPEGAAFLPAWVRRDLEKAGVTGFEPVASPTHWKGTTVKNVNGTIVRMHEITNAGKPIMSKPIKSTEPIPRLRRILQQSSQSNLTILNRAVDEGICVLKYSGNL